MAQEDVQGLHKLWLENQIQFLFSPEPSLEER